MTDYNDAPTDTENTYMGIDMTPTTKDTTIDDLVKLAISDAVAPLLERIEVLEAKLSNNDQQGLTPTQYDEVEDRFREMIDQVSFETTASIW